MRASLLLVYNYRSKRRSKHRSIFVSKRLSHLAHSSPIVSPKRAKSIQHILALPAWAPVTPAPRSATSWSPGHARARQGPRVPGWRILLWWTLYLHVHHRPRLLVSILFYFAGSYLPPPPVEH